MWKAVVNLMNEDFTPSEEDFAHYEKILMAHDTQVMITVLREVSRKLNECAVVAYQERGENDDRYVVIGSCARYVEVWADNMVINDLEIQ